MKTNCNRSAATVAPWASARAASCGLAAISALTACGGTLWVNKEYKEGPRPSKEEVLLLPVEVHRLPDSLAKAVEAQVNEEVTRAFGSHSVTLHLVRDRFLPAGYGNLPWQVAKGMYLRGRHANSGRLVGQGHEWLDGLGAQAKQFLAWAGEVLGDPKPTAGAPPKRRYLLSFYLDRHARTDDPKQGVHLHLRLMGGLFDAHRMRTVAVTWLDLKVRPNPEALKEALTGVGGKLRDVLTGAGL
ncbi:MAG: hypothetical protein RBU30_21825 [Polyangia bacterium]|jgi:hypothetical protein|nr:hypothetical protein [Polyangia bacterium]